ARQLALRPWAVEAASAEADIAFLRAQAGPALCQSLALCYWAGKSATVDRFNLTDAFARGRRDPGELARKVEQREFAAIQLGSFAHAAPPSWASIMQALGRQYRAAHDSPLGVIFLVNPPAAPRAGQG